MAEPFLGEIRLFTFNYAPVGWALCDGSILPASQNQALNALLGTTFGGTAGVNFGLPDMRGRAPLNMGAMPDGTYYYKMGNSGGSETVKLDASTCPPHTHTLTASNTMGTVQNPATVSSIYASDSDATPTNTYGAPGTGSQTTTLAVSTIGATGGSAGHNNMQPFLVLNFCIATTGYWPPRAD